MQRTRPEGRRPTAASGASRFVTTPGRGERTVRRGVAALGLHSRDVRDYRLSAIPDVGRGSKRGSTVRSRTRQAGLVRARIASRQDLLRAGFSPRDVRVGVASGDLVALTHGWYSTDELGDAAYLRALLRILPPDTVFAGPTAALLHGVDVAEPSPDRAPVRLSVVRPPGSRALRRAGLRCRVMEVAQDDVCEVSGVPVTSPLRTAIDLAASRALPQATATLEAFVRAGAVTVDAIARRVAAMRGRRGVRMLREALAAMDARSESPPETTLRLRLREVGFEAVPQRPVTAPHGREPYRVDLAVMRAGRRIAVEYFSDAFHPREGPIAVHDATRLAHIRAQGWQVVVVRAEDLRGERRTFEDEVATRLGIAARGGLRARWASTRFDLYRNAWTRITVPRSWRWTPPRE